MKAATAILAGLIVSCLMFEQSQAQTPLIVPISSAYSVPAPYAWSAGYAHRPAWYGYGYHASTAAEGYMRGVAAMTRAQGQYNLMTSQASVYNQQARSMSLDNHKKGVETYYAARKTNREAREAERGPRPTKEDLVRLAKEAAPDRLGNDQLHAATGRIAWPASLQSEEFAAYRAQVEEIFARRASSGRVGSQESQLVGQATGAMRTLLRSQIHEMSPMEYTSARRFLDGLTYEAQLSTS